MKIITQPVILTLSLILVNASQDCNDLFERYKTLRSRCSFPTMAISSCCDLITFASPSGVYKLKKNAFSCTDVYCNMADGGGWIVIQRNNKGSLVSFNRQWNDYEEGFGDLYTGFWYGLANIRYLTQTGQWEMRIDYQSTNNTWSYLHYNQFSVGCATEQYPLTVGGFTGVGTDWFAFHPLNGTKFSTPDNDNDKHHGNCAALLKSGWWYNNCSNIDINRQPPYVTHNVLSAEMKIRPKDCVSQY